MRVLFHLGILCKLKQKEYLCLSTVDIQHPAIMAQAQAGSPSIPTAQLLSAGLHPFAYPHHLLESHQETISFPVSLKQEGFSCWGSPQGSSTITIMDFKKLM